MNLNLISKQDLLKLQSLICIGIVFLFILFIYIPLHKKIIELEYQTNLHHNQLKKILSLEQTYKSLLTTGMEFKFGIHTSDSIVSDIQDILKQIGIEKNLVSIIPSNRKLDNNHIEQYVDIKLEDIGLKETLNFLKTIKKLKHIYIQRLNIRRKKGELNTITMRILLKTQKIS